MYEKSFKISLINGIQICFFIRYQQVNPVFSAWHILCLKYFSNKTVGAAREEEADLE